MVTSPFSMHARVVPRQHLATTVPLPSAGCLRSDAREKPTRRRRRRRRRIAIFTITIGRHDPGALSRAAGDDIEGNTAHTTMPSAVEMSSERKHVQQQGKEVVEHDDADPNRV